MNINNVIDELQKYCFKDDKTIKKEKELLNNYQIEYLTGYIGILMNQYKDVNKFEVYLNIKSADKIACPLLYKQFDNEIESKSYFDELKELVENNNEEYIVNRCKIKI